MVFFIVNCGLKVGNSFLYIFSRFLSFKEILDTFDFLCLCFFSLTDLFLCASETKKTTTTRRVSIFSDDKETFLKRGKHELTPSSKAAPEPSKNLRRKTLDFQDHNDVNDSVKSQYNFNNGMCSVIQAVKK